MGDQSVFTGPDERVPPRLEGPFMNCPYHNPIGLAMLPRVLGTVHKSFPDR